MTSDATNSQAEKSAAAGDEEEAAGCCRRSRWRSTWRVARCCGTLELFVLNHCGLLLCFMIGIVYSGGAIRTIERRFGLRSSQSGFLFSCNDITQTILVLFVGHFSRRARKPRIISILILFSAAAFALMASPHWLFDSSSSATAGNKTVPSTGAAANATSSVLQPRSFCSASEFSTTRNKSIICDVTSAAATAAAAADGQNAVPAAYYVFIAAQLLSGVGTPGLSVLGLTYIDENAPPAKSSLYIGFVTSMYAVAPIGGFMLAAFTLQLPENLRSTDSSKPDDPSFIGCWWLGYIICAVALAALAIPMWFFPKTIRHRAKGGVSQPLTSNNTDNMCHDQPTDKLRKQFKELPRSILRLWRNKAYIVNMGYTVCYAYIVMGVTANIVRYIEIHFYEKAFVASIVAAVGCAVAGSIGGFAGGIVMSRTKMTPVGAVRLMVFASSVFAAGLLVIIFLACPQVEIAGGIDRTHQTFTLLNDCNRHCDCPTDRQAFLPVCANDNVTYFSACFAGCTEFANGTYGGCSCLKDGSTSLGQQNDATTPLGKFSETVRPGLCVTGCKLIVPFAIVTFVISLIGNAAQVAWTMVNFRLVDKDERSFALAFSAFMMSFAGFIPAPIIFGRLIDSSCRLWQHSVAASSSSSCHGNPTDGGSCLLYDTFKFRMRTYGVAFGIKLFDLTLATILYLLIRNRTFTAESLEMDEKQKQENKDMDGNATTNNGTENKQLLQINVNGK